MAAITDKSIGLVNESSFGTYVAPTRFYEGAEIATSWDKNIVQGAGLRVGSRVARSGRRVVPTASGKVEVTVEACTKGMGLLWESCLGASASTLVSGSTYQQNITLATGTVLPSRTVQVGQVNDAGTVTAHSFLGCTVSEWEFELANELATLKATFDAAKIDTSQSYASPSYPSSVSLFHHALAGVTIGGSVTAPTTTALATGGTSVANVRSFKLSGNNTIADDRFNFGGGGRKARQVAGMADLTGELVVEYTDTTLRDAFLNETEVPVVLTLTSADALSAGFATLQIVLSAVKFDGALPTTTDGLDTITAPFRVLDNLTATQPIWVVHRTADTAV